MKISYLTSVAVAALALTAGAAAAGTVTSPVGFFTPLPVTPAVTSVASGFDSNKATSSATTFVDNYEFTIGGNYDTTLSGDFDNKLSGSNITSVDLTLFKGIPGASTEIDTTGIDLIPTSKGTYSYFLDDVLTPELTITCKRTSSYRPVTLASIAYPLSLRRFRVYPSRAPGRSCSQAWR